MPADAVQSPEFLLTKVVANQPYPDAQTTALAQLTRDLITSLKPQFSSASYNFVAPVNETFVISGGTVDASRRIAAGVSATVRLRTVPQGVAGTDVAHYIYILDSAGNSEAVLITGGTAAAGGSNQTLTFTPASTHSGTTWRLMSATAGLQEGVNVVGPLGGRLTIPGGNNTMYAKVTCPYSMSIRGAGFQVTTLSMATGFVTRAMEFNSTAGTRVDVGDFAISYSTNGTSQEGLYFKNISDGLLSNFEVINAYDGVTMVSVARFIVSCFGILPRNNAFNISSDPLSTVSVVSVPTITTGYCSMQAGVGNVFTLAGTIAGMIVKGVNTALGLNALSFVSATDTVNEVTVASDCIFDSLAGTVVNVQVSGTAQASRWSIHGTCSLTAGAVNGVLLAAATAGLIVGVDIDITVVCNAAAANGINLQGVVGGQVTATIINNDVGGNAILLDGVACTDIVISGGLLGAGAFYTPTNQMAYGVFVAAQAHNRINVLANRTYGSTAQVQNNSTVGVGAVVWDSN